MAIRHVLTVYDGTPASDTLLDMVCKIVHPHRARLTILHVNVVPRSQRLPTYQPGSDPETEALLREAEGLAERWKVKAACAVRYARAWGPAVVAESRVSGVDLVALLAPQVGISSPAERLGADIDYVLHRLTCAVMICRPSLEGPELEQE
jgi:nucleotide-binding universal stress UspA family protein